jgi:cephalosporin-C deacetylase-like acetyl esterase
MKPTTVALLVMACLHHAPLSAQTQTEDPLLRWMDNIAQQQLDRRESAIAGIHNVADANRRKQLVREKLSEILGGLPNYNGPLNPRITGHIRNELYTIEKVIFESLSGFYVTANVYRPNQTGSYPAVLLPAGHTQEGKPEPQLVAANLAMKGFVALTYDPIGQGEREQTFIRELGRPLAGGSVNEHVQAGAQSILVGESVARYFIWDAKRAVDYLISRPDVDAARIGCAGCSGGGALTTYVGTFDPRVKTAAPACYISSYRLLFRGPSPDSEMSFPAFLAKGLDMADLIELSAPMPWLILATAGDYFTPEGARLAYEESRHWYSLYGAADKVQFFVGPGPHGTPLETREMIYKWMIRWLKDGSGDFHEQPAKLYTNRELLVTRSGNVDDEPGSRKLHQLILDDLHARERPGTISELLTELRRLGVPSEGPPPTVKIIDESNTQDYRLTQVRFEGEPGVEIGGKLYIPRSAGRKPAVLLLEDKSLPVPLHVSRSPATAPLAQALARSGRVVLELEPRGAPPAINGPPFIGDWLSNARANLIGRNLPAMRAHDILRGVDALAARSDVDAASIRGIARGVKGVWLLLAAAVDPRLGKIWLDRTPYSLRAALESSMSVNLFDAVIPSFALHWDLEDLMKAMGSRPVWWTDPTNWMDQLVSVGPRFRYRYVLGDLTDRSGAQDDEYIREFIK